ncbi:hypothetical protein BVY03_03030 [bacterium K02(2017)]|nr:hypothetical protein BVY03_03030 [bacterium K02(2017)]
MVNKLFHHIKFYYRAYRRLELLNKSASLSFYTLISIFPMLMLLAVLFDKLVIQDILLKSLSAFILESLPYQSDFIMQMVANVFKSQSKFSWFGLITLFFTAQVLYMNLGKIVNSLLHTSNKRHFIINRLFFLIWMISIVFVILSPLIFEMIMGWMISFGFEFKAYSQFFIRGGFVFVGMVSFLVVMLILPTNRLNLKRLLYGSIGFALTLQIGKAIFKWFTYINIDRYNLIYGSLSSIILVLLWIFYFYNMFLFFIYWVGRERDPHFTEKN